VPRAVAVVISQPPVEKSHQGVLSLLSDLGNQMLSWGRHHEIYKSHTSDPRKEEKTEVKGDEKHKSLGQQGPASSVPCGYELEVRIQTEQEDYLWYDSQPTETSELLPEATVPMVTGPNPPCALFPRRTESELRNPQQRVLAVVRNLSRTCVQTEESLDIIYESSERDERYCKVKQVLKKFINKHCRKLNSLQQGTGKERTAVSTLDLPGEEATSLTQTQTSVTGHVHAETDPATDGPRNSNGLPGAADTGDGPLNSPHGRWKPGSRWKLSLAKPARVSAVAKAASAAASTCGGFPARTGTGILSGDTKRHWMWCLSNRDCGKGQRVLQRSDPRRRCALRGGQIFTGAWKAFN
ncbi:hypothetical protein GH733_013599, partial [Mirounga leonina]